VLQAYFAAGDLPSTVTQCATVIQAPHHASIPSGCQDTNGYAGAVLHDVRNCSDMCKDGNSIAALQHEFGVQMMGGEEKAANFAGWCIDNTWASMSAVRELEILQPEWISYGRAAHCGHLGKKDFSKYNLDSIIRHSIIIVERRVHFHCYICGTKLLIRTLDYSKSNDGSFWFGLTSPDCMRKRPADTAHPGAVSDSATPLLK
jgi:hypothetical protein